LSSRRTRRLYHEAQESVAVTISETVATSAHRRDPGAVNVPAVSAEALETIGPYLTLGANCDFQAQSQSAGQRDSDQYSGEVADLDVRPSLSDLTAAQTGQRSVNQSASVIAEERGCA